MRATTRAGLLFLVGVCGFCSCSTNAHWNAPGAPPAESPAFHGARGTSESVIKHVVIIVQENRTVDNLFQFLRGANTQSYGLNSQGQKVTLQPQPLSVPWDISHVHNYWLLDYANGAMNGFDLEKCSIGQCPADASYSYVPESDVAPYYALAETYTFADELFETDQGPSFASHQYLVSGTSTVSDGSPEQGFRQSEFAVS